MEYKFRFNCKGYDSFIDFLKAYSIICVLFGHTFGFLLDKVAYGVWAGMQVPFFVIVQSFHFYKKEKSRVDLRKAFVRVIIPFLIIETITFVLAYLFGIGDIKSLSDMFLHRGGFGPGSYFPWIYIQCALILPVFAPILGKWNKIVSFIFFIIICEGLEILSSIIGVSDEVYRLLSIRYFFLFYYGWMWAKEGITLNKTTLLITFLSLLSIIYFEYFSVNDEPWFYDTGFVFHRWPCYFYVAYGLTALLHYLWERINKCSVIERSVQLLAKSSYEIFLVQMSIIFLFDYKCLYSIIPSIYVAFVIWIIITWMMSILLGVFINKVLYQNQKH